MFIESPCAIITIVSTVCVKVSFWNYAVHGLVLPINFHMQLYERLIL